MNKFETLGKALWLWSCSKLHSRWPLESAIHYIIPAIEFEQCRLMLDENGMPRGYASWAWLNPQTEHKYIMDPNSLSYNDWRSGDRLWFIDFISPFDFRDTIKLRRLMGQVHGENYLARSIRLRRDGKAQVLEHSGGSVNMQKSKELKEQFYTEAKEFFSKK